MTSRVSRRAFLGSAGAAALVTVPGSRLAGAQERSEAQLRADVAIAGGHLSSLVAAHELSRRGVDVAVLAGDAPVVDLEPCLQGRHERLAGLGRSLGLRIETLRSRGAALEGGATSAEEVSEPGAFSADGRTAAEIRTAFRKLDRMASEFDAAGPWTAVNASVRDALTLGGWIDQSIAGDGARHRLQQGFELIFGAPAAEISLLFALATVASAGGAGDLFDAAYYPDASIHGLREALARSLRTRLHEGLVQSLEVADGGVLLRVGDSAVSARRAIVSDPSLFGGGSRARFGPGSVVTVSCTYSSGPWRSRGLSGRVLGDGAPVQAVWPGADGRTLVATVAGAEARRTNGDDLRDAVLDALGRWLGPEAAHPSGCEVTVGSTTARVVAPPGALGALGSELRTAEGPLYPAGPETATAWIGHGEGQVEIGRRVADEVVAGLRGHGIEV